MQAEMPLRCDRGDCRRKGPVEGLGPVRRYRNKRDTRKRVGRDKGSEVSSQNKKKVGHARTRNRTRDTTMGTLYFTTKLFARFNI